jgi:iron complex outermembrane receptor protein
VYENIINPCEIGTATGFRAKCRPANFVDTEIDQFSLKGVFQFNRFELVSISAFERSASNSAASVDDVDPLSEGAQQLMAIGLPNLGLGFYGEFELENFQQELRLASNDTWKWQWIIGVQYFKEKATGHKNWSANFGTVTLQTNNPWSNESASIFGQATVPITDRLSFTVGGRHIEDTYKLRDELDYSDPFVNPAFGGVSFGKLKRDESFNTFTTRLEYKRDDWLVYGGVTSGFKAGSLNNDGPRYGEADPEELISYEVGVKSTWNDGRLHVNGSVFFYDYKDPHVTFIDNSVGGTRLLNIPDAEVLGADLDLTGLLSDRFSWFFNMTALDAEYTSDAQVNLSIGPARLDTKGKRMGGTPKFQMAAGFDWILPIRQNADVVFTPTVAYNSGIWFDPENRSGSGKDGVSDDGYTIVNLNLRYQPHDANWKVTAWMKNALDEKYNRGGAAAGLLLFGWAGDPRQVGLSVAYDF